MRAPLLSANAKKNALLTLGSLVFALLVAEIALRILDPVRPVDRVEFEVDRETYWRVRANQSDNRPPATHVNSQGFRGIRDVGEKQPGQTRVFVLGDSYTWGQGVADDQTYSAQLEAASDGLLDVINGGTPGWGVFQFQARLRRWIDDIDPDVIVVLIITMDVLRQPYASKEEEEAFLRKSALRNNIRRISKLVTVTVRLLERIGLQAQNRQLDNARPMDRTGGVSSTVYDRLLASDTDRLTDMVNLAKERDMEFVLVAWPQQVPNTPAFLAAMESFAEDHDVTYVDLSSSLAPYGSDEYSLPYDDHPNAFGHSLVADALSKVLAGLRADQQ